MRVLYEALNFNDQIYQLPLRTNCELVGHVPSISDNEKTWGEYCFSSLDSKQPVPLPMNRFHL